MSSSAGVSELMDAEKKASTVVAEARAARSDRLKEWYRTFGKVFLESVPVADRAAFLDDYRTACAHRLGGENRLDFVRQRWRAVRRDDRSR